MSTDVKSVTLSLSNPTDSSFHEGKPVQKGLCIIALSIAVVIFILFAADLIMGLTSQSSMAPFKYAPGLIMDIVFILVSGILAAMSWFTLREQV